MAVGGSIVVNLIARTEAFTKGIKASKYRIRQLEKATQRTMMIVRRFGMIAAGVAIGGMTVLVKKSMQTIDEIAKLSDRIGTSTEFLSAFGHEATLAGTSAAQFNKSLEMFVRRMGEAAQGTGEAQRGMEKLGLSAEHLLSITTEDAFLEVAEGIRQLETQAEKAAAAYQFFGRSGAQMLNLLEGDLSQVQARAEELGITFDRKMAAGVERANDAMANMKMAVNGIANSMAISLAPMIEEIADRIADWVSGEHSLEKVERLVRRVSIGMSYVHDAFLGVKAVMHSLVALGQAFVGVLLTGAEKAMEALERISRLLRQHETADTIASDRESIAGMRDEFNAAAAESAQKGLEAWLDMGKSRKQMEQFFDEVDKRRDEYQRKAVELGAGLLDEDDATDSVGEAFGEASAMEVSRHVSVAGLSMGGMTDKQSETNSLLREQNRMISELESKLVMN